MMHCTCALGHGQQTEQDRARGLQAAYDGGVFAGHALGKDRGAGARMLARDVAQGLDRNRHAVQRTTVFTATNLSFRLAGRDERAVIGDYRVASQAIVVKLDAGKHVAG